MSSSSPDEQLLGKVLAVMARPILRFHVIAQVEAERPGLHAYEWCFKRLNNDHKVHFKAHG